MRRMFLALAVAIVTSTLIIGQTSRNNTRDLDQAHNSKAQREVLAIDDRRRDALLRGDAAPLWQIYADDYTLVSAAGDVYSKSDQIKDLSAGQVRYEKIEVTERASRVYGDVVILLSRERSNIVRAGRQVGGDIRVTRVYKKFGPQWRLLATHASAIGP
jgi:ketosteroid isomerase-like protein